MAKTETLTVEVRPETRLRLETMAAETRRSKDDLADLAIARFIESEEEIIAGIEVARQQIRDGLGIPHEEAMRRLDEAIERGAQRHKSRR
jgi:predicted transcriptional regulator